MAVALADGNGIDALSMRNLAQELGVVPMALYKHVANKEQLLDGMVDPIVGEIAPPVRRRRRLEGRHPPAHPLRAQGAPPPPLGVTRHRVARHRMWGFTRELFPSPPVTDPEAAAATMAALGARWPHIIEIATAGAHAEGGQIVGGGCDDQFEFEFSLDLLLDGFDRLDREGWTATPR